LLGYRDIFVLLLSWEVLESCTLETSVAICPAGMVLPLRGYIFDTSDPPKDLKQTVEDCWSVILVFQALLADYLW